MTWPAARPVLCFVTDRSRAPRPDTLDQLVVRIGAAARAGIDAIQIRERDLDDATLLALVRRARAVLEGTGARLIVNDRVDVALAGGADGVHLRADAFVGSRIRARAPAPFIIGRSIHSPTDAVAAERDGGCDYLLFGTVFPSAGKPPAHAVAGMAALAGVVRAVALPVIAIGGIDLDPDRARAVAAAGAAGAAAIGAFMSAAGETELQSRIARMRRAFDTGSAVV